MGKMKRKVMWGVTWIASALLSLRAGWMWQGSCASREHTPQVPDLPVYAPQCSNSLDRLLRTASSVCFVGDSVTAGSENGGVPWFASLVGSYKSLIINNLSCGGYDTSSFADVSRQSSSGGSLYHSSRNK